MFSRKLNYSWFKNIVTHHGFLPYETVSLQVFYIVFVALATPVGVTIGLVVTEHVDATSGVQTLVIGILQVQ